VDGCTIGEDVQVAGRIFLNESVVLPHKSVSATQLSAGTIIM
jgi:hypothetical protein